MSALERRHARITNSTYCCFVVDILDGHWKIYLHFPKSFAQCDHVFFTIADDSLADLKFGDINADLDDGAGNISAENQGIVHADVWLVLHLLSLA
jgi:hypothetical protein